MVRAVKKDFGGGSAEAQLEHSTTSITSEPVAFIEKSHV